MRSRCSSWEPQPAKIPADKQGLPWSSCGHQTSFTWLEPKPAWLQPSKTQRATAQQSPPDLLTHRMVSELKWLFRTTRFGVTCYVSTMSEHRGWGDWVFLSFAYCCFKQGLCACNYLKWGLTGLGWTLNPGTGVFITRPREGESRLEWCAYKPGNAKDCQKHQALGEQRGADCPSEPTGRSHPDFRPPATS